MKKLIGLTVLLALASCASNASSGNLNSGGYPNGIPIPSKKGYLLSPYNQKVIDVRGIPAGTLVADPTYAASDNKYFRVPSGSDTPYNPVKTQQYADNSVSNTSRREKSGFAKFLGGALEVAVGTVGVVAQSQLNSGSSSSGSSYNANKTEAQSPQGTQYTGMLGLSELGAASGPVSVVFRASESCKGKAIVHSSVAQKYSWVIAKGYASGYGRTVNGSTGYHTDNFEIMFNKNGPYTKEGLFWTNGNWDFHRGLKVVNITSVNYIK